jgi:aminoglycoside phosphotransferase (APT) family kinase protein
VTRLHDDEVAVDLALATRLVSSQFPEWSDLPIRPVRSGGTDNAVFRLGDDLVLRIPITPAADGRLEQEHAWLPHVGPHLPLAVPEPVARGVAAGGMPWGWSVYQWIEGSPASPERLGDPTRAAEMIGDFVRAMHAIDPTNGPVAGSGRGVPLAMRDVATRRAIEECGPEIEAPASIEVWESAVRAPVWDRPAVWIHGDLWETNVLLDAAGSVAAVIDFGCLGIGDPATDLTVAWNLFDGPGRRVFRDRTGVDAATWERGRGWALSFAVIALPYYRTTNPVIVANARRMIAAVLEDAD